MKQRLGLGFKGERDYVHGTDLFNAVQSLVSQDRPDSFISVLAFRRFARHDCDLLYVAPDHLSNVVAQGVISAGDGSRHFWVEESERPAVGRRPYDESSITESALIAGKAISSTVRSIFTPVEEIIALTKRLTYELAPEIDGNWVFGQLGLDRPIPHDYSEIGIEQNSIMANRFSTNSIYIDKRYCGDIRFIVAKP